MKVSGPVVSGPFVSCLMVLSTALAIALASPAAADPKPRGAKTATPQQVTQAYAGKTDLWETDCSGGIYFGPNGQARAWCADAGDSLGAGQWGVEDDGRLCYRMTWFFPDGGRAGTERGERTCISHIATGNGSLWRQWSGETEWWPLDDTSGLTRGYRFQEQVRQTRADLGL